MKVNQRIIHERKIFAHLDQREIYHLLTKAVAEAAGVEFGQRTQVRVLLRQEDRPGTAGFRHYAEVELTQDMSDQPCDGGETEENND